jgi:hypothetical protein
MGHHFYLPIAVFGIAAVHPKQIAGKEGRLFPAGAGTDFYNHILLIIKAVF